MCFVQEAYQKILQKINSEISVNGTVYDFPVDCSSIEKEDILNIPEYFMLKDNIK